jgi:rRNA maturation RNase YbeY
VARVIDVATDKVRIPVARARVQRAAELVLVAERVRDAQLSIAFVTEADITRLNWRHLRHRGPTDVISFGMQAAPGSATRVGDVYISPDVARRNAQAHGASVREEILRLVVHGVLHVLGYDHPDGQARYGSVMWKRQEQLLARALKAA